MQKRHQCILKLFMLTLILVSTIICTKIVPVSASHAEQYSYDVNVKVPTQLEIKNKLESLSNIYTKYSVEADFTKPYAAGTLNKETLEDALAWMNAVRFIAGIPEVSLSTEYCTYAQAASMVNFINDLPSHYPEQPIGMDNSLYQTGYDGSGRCDISYGYGLDYSKGVQFSDIIINNWMNDGDENNIWCLGHRRWILNPAMTKTGFGCVYDPHNAISKLKYIAALYAMDKSGSSSEYYGISWPANNTPISFFNTDYPWSISMGKNVSSDTKVELVRLSDNKTWTFSEGSNNFYINNDAYGLKGCIIFKPTGISMNHGDVYKVNITGTSINVQYYVNFFDVNKVSESTTDVEQTDNTGNTDKSNNQSGTDNDVKPVTIIQSTVDNTEKLDYTQNTTVTNKDGSKTEVKFDTSNKKEVKVTVKNTTKNKQVETITYVVLDNNKLRVSSISTKNKTVNIANTVTINGVKCTVTEIGPNVLAKNKTVTKITINNEIKRIYANAFENNIKLKNIIIMASNNMIIDTKAFSGINQKATFTIKGSTVYTNNVKTQLLASGIPKKSKIKLKKS